MKSYNHIQQEALDKTTKVIKKKFVTWWNYLQKLSNYRLKFNEFHDDILEKEEWILEGPFYSIFLWSDVQLKLWKAYLSELLYLTPV